MIAPDELLSILERILPLIERDSSVLEGWSKTEDGQKVVQFVIQIGKYNTNRTYAVGA
jgi:prophage antirepressor-like protein